MQATLSEFLDGLKKPFQTPEQQTTNTGNAIASYALAIAMFVLVKKGL